MHGLGDFCHSDLTGILPI